MNPILAKNPKLEYLLVALNTCFHNLATYAAEAEEEISNQLDQLGARRFYLSSFPDTEMLPPLSNLHELYQMQLKDYYDVVMQEEDFDEK